MGDAARTWDQCPRGIGPGAGQSRSPGADLAPREAGARAPREATAPLGTSAPLRSRRPAARSQGRACWWQSPRDRLSARSSASRSESRTRSGSGARRLTFSPGCPLRRLGLGPSPVKGAAGCEWPGTAAPPCAPSGSPARSGRGPREPRLAAPGATPAAGAPPRQATPGERGRVPTQVAAPPRKCAGAGVPELKERKSVSPRGDGRSALPTGAAQGTCGAPSPPAPEPAGARGSGGGGSSSGGSSGVCSREVGERVGSRQPPALTSARGKLGPRGWRAHRGDAGGGGGGGGTPGRGRGWRPCGPRGREAGPGPPRRPPLGGRGPAGHSLRATSPRRWAAASKKGGGSRATWEPGHPAT